MDIHEPSCDTGQRPAERDAPIFRWEYPERVKAIGKVTPLQVSEMILAETIRRLPAVAKYLAGAEASAKLALTSCTSPDDCFLGVWAREMEEGAAVRMVATMECHDGDVYRHWAYTNFSAVFADGRIMADCVPVGQSLADVLPSFPNAPVMIIETEHISGPSEIVDHEYMQRESVTVFITDATRRPARSATNRLSLVKSPPATWLSSSPLGPAVPRTSTSVSAGPRDRWIPNPESFAEEQGKQNTPAKRKAGTHH